MTVTGYGVDRMDYSNGTFSDDSQTALIFIEGVPGGFNEKWCVCLSTTTRGGYTALVFFKQDTLGKERLLTKIR